MNIGLRKSDSDVGFTEAFVDFVEELALRLGKAFAGSKLVDSSKQFCQMRSNGERMNEMSVLKNIRQRDFTSEKFPLV